MQPILATSYEGLGESLMVLSFWAVAVLFLLSAMLISLRKSRSAGHKVALVACFAATLQFAVYWYLKEAAQLGTAALTIVFFLVPLAASVSLWWFTRQPNDPADESVSKKA